LRPNLAKSAPNVPATIISAIEQSVAALEELDPSVRETVLPAYMHSIAQTFLIGVVASVLISLCALFVNNCHLLG
jgi:capsular polysaccharide biosynthesis protein